MPTPSFAPYTPPPPVVPLWQRVVPPMVVVVVALLAMGRILGNGFALQWDDALTLAKNDRLNPPSLDSVSWYWFNPSWDIYIPVSYTVWGVIANYDYSEEPD